MRNINKIKEHVKIYYLVTLKYCQMLITGDNMHSGTEPIPLHPHIAGGLAVPRAPF